MSLHTTRLLQFARSISTKQIPNTANHSLSPVIRFGGGLVIGVGAGALMGTTSALYTRGNRYFKTGDLNCHSEKDPGNITQSTKEYAYCVGLPAGIVGGCFSAFHHPFSSILSLIIAAAVLELTDQAQKSLSARPK